MTTDPQPGRNSSPLGPSFFTRAVGVFVIVLGASTWPHIHGELVIAGLGFMGAPSFFPGKEKD